MPGTKVTSSFPDEALTEGEIRVSTVNRIVVQAANVLQTMLVSSCDKSFQLKRNTSCNLDSGSTGVPSLPILRMFPIPQGFIEGSVLINDHGLITMPKC